MTNGIDLRCLIDDGALKASHELEESEVTFSSIKEKIGRDFGTYEQ